MPVYNESRTLRTIVERVLAAPVDCDLELVCVDDCSTDSSLDILHELAAADPRITVIAQPINMGKGKAIRTAIDQMTGDIGIIQDADLEYDPEDYPRIISPIVDGKADAVYGSRFASSEVRRVLFFWHAMGNRVLTAFSNMANDLNLTDMETCYKAVRADLLKRLRLTSDRFGLEPEITARLARWGARIYEVPVSYHGRSYAEGKNIGWRDGVEALWLILKFKFIDTKATDDDSIVTRQALGKAPRFRRWILDEFNDYLGTRVLEVNAGPGHSTAHLLDRGLLVVTDSEPIHVETLKRRFGHLENLEVELWDFDARPLEGKAVDTAILFDGLQRTAEPKTLLSNVAGAVDHRGHILIQVPAGADLLGAMDRAVGHVRRFDQQDLEELITAAGLDLVFIKPFNRLGALGWRMHHASGTSSISVLEARGFDHLVPLARSFDAMSSGPSLSWLAVARVR